MSMSENKSTELITELLAAMLFRALDESPDLLHKIFNEPEVQDSAIHQALVAHNSARHDELKQRMQFMGKVRQSKDKQPTNEAPIARTPNGSVNFANANAAVRKRFNDGLANKR